MSDTWMTVAIHLPEGAGEELLAHLKEKMGFEPAETLVPGREAQTMSGPDDAWLSFLRWPGRQ